MRTVGWRALFGEGSGCSAARRRRQHHAAEFIANLVQCGQPLGRVTSGIGEHVASLGGAGALRQEDVRCASQASRSLASSSCVFTPSGSARGTCGLAPLVVRARGQHERLRCRGQVTQRHRAVESAPRLTAVLACFIQRAIRLTEVGPWGVLSKLPERRRVQAQGLPASCAAAVKTGMTPTRWLIVAFWTDHDHGRRRLLRDPGTPCSPPPAAQNPRAALVPARPCLRPRPCRSADADVRMTHYVMTHIVPGMRSVFTVNVTVQNRRCRKKRLASN